MVTGVYQNKPETLLPGTARLVRVKVVLPPTFFDPAEVEVVVAEDAVPQVSTERED